MQSALVRLSLICGMFLAALATGYALSSSLGQEALRSEAEDQLAKLMRGRVEIDRADLRIRSGLWIEGRGVRVYPSASGPGLSSDRVAARLDVIALLMGRFRIRDLILDGIHLEIERSVADRWSPYLINAIDRRSDGGDPDDLERKLSVFRVIDAITRVLLQSPIIAQRIEIIGGSVRLTDRYVRAKGKAPFQVRIDSIDGTLQHDWIGNRAKIELAGLLRDEARNQVPIEVFGERRADGGMDLSVAVTKLELESYRDYFQDQIPAARLAREAGDTTRVERAFAGTLSGVLHFDTPLPDHGVLEIDWSADRLSVGIMRGNEILNLESPRIQLRARIEIHPGRLRISEAELRGPNVRGEFSGDIERPLRRSSAANFAVYFHDVSIPALARVVNAMPEGERKPLLHAFTRIEEGRIVRIGGSGTERLSVWQAVLAGERMNLPTGLSMSVEVAGVTIQLGAYERLTDLTGTATWTRDQIKIRRSRARRNGVPTPELNLTLEGFPALINDLDPYDEDRVSSAGLRGLSLLDQLFARGGTDEGEPQIASGKPIEIDIDIDFVEHTALIWPLRNAKVEAVLHEGGQSFHFVRGTWGGAQLSGDVLLTRDPNPTVDAYLKLWPATGESDSPPPASRDRVPSPGSWAAGRFSVAGLHGKHWPVGETQAVFSLIGDNLELDEIHGQLVPHGQLEGNFRLSLARADQLDFEINFKIRDGQAGRLLAAVGFPEDFATGSLDVTGTLGGPIALGQPVFANVEGQIKIAGHDGEIRQSIPLVSALAHVIEGLSPGRASDVLVYETIDTTVNFQRGTIATDEIKLDGPLRVFLSGRFDFAKPGREVEAEIGIFLFRQIDLLLGKVPLIGSLIPGGKERGLFGAFFAVSGTLDEPVLEAMPMKSLTEGAPLPDILKAPFAAIREALQGQGRGQGQDQKRRQEPQSNPEHTQPAP
ncbi:MAG: hypothetical protein IH973_06720 [Myxococcales bacterium]|nr:hypothetical protein [Myxococcales bacterium]